MKQVYGRPNDAAWENALQYDYKVNKKLSVRVVDNGIILPAINTENHDAYKGGVCDSNFNFVAGRIHNSDETGTPCVKESYVVDSSELEYVDEIVVFGGALISPFGHMLLDNMTRMWWFVKNPDTHYKFAFITILGPEKDYMYWFYENLGIPHENILFIKKPTKFRQIIVPEQSHHNWRPGDFTDEFMMPYRLIQKKFIGVTTKKLPAKIYLTKRFVEISELGGGAQQLMKSTSKNITGLRGSK